MNNTNVTKLDTIFDARGSLTEIVRIDRDSNGPIQQVYMTTVLPGISKAWHLHREQTDRMVCVKGRVLFVTLFIPEIDKDALPKPNHLQSYPPLFLEEQKRADLKKIVMDGTNPSLITIYKGYWHGFKNIGNEEAIIINCPNQLYNYDEPDEVRESIDRFNHIFAWGASVDG
jgi:dTDP-4-dehydrorhamnose 3,5-epimerase